MVDDVATDQPAGRPFTERIAEYERRLDRALQAALPSAAATPAHLHEMMRGAIPRIGERTGALLVYAAGEAVQAPPPLLDAPAVAIELIHAFLHIHHGLGSAGRIEGRRSEAIAILATDALQPLAFQILATAPAMQARPAVQTYMIGLLAEACGANGLAGGRSLYLGNDMPDRAELEHSYRLRPGRLIRASVLCAAACASGTGEQELHALERFSDALGIGSRISRDLEELRAGAARADSITYPGRFGTPNAQARCAALARTALAAIDGFGARADGLRTMLRYLIAPAGQTSAAGS